MTEQQTDIDELKDVTPWDAGLKPKERLFLLEMCTSEENWLRPDKAYREITKKYDKKTGQTVYVDDRSASKGANRYLQKPKIKEALKKLLQQQQPELDEQNVYRVLHEMQTIAFYNPADIINDKGQLKKPLQELGDLAKCVTEIKVTKYGTQVMLADRFKYIEAICKYLNLIRPEVQTEKVLQVIEVAPKVEGNGLIDAVEAWNAKAAEEN